MGLKKTPLYALHHSLDAKFTDFSGYEMPIHYSSVIKEHTAVRTRAGLFDVSHMGEIEIRGSRAFFALQSVTTNDLARLRLGRAQYTLLCNEQGGVLDDVIVYCISEQHFLVCVNASNTTKILRWLSTREFRDATVGNLTDSTAMLALQGPASKDILSRVASFDLIKLKSFGFLKGQVAGIDAVVARTGYTGEDGFEFFTANDDAPKLWEVLMKTGSADGLLPVGLAARDTLRIEMGYPLYGSELDEVTTPIEAGLKRYVHLDGDDFTGRAALVEEQDEGSKKTLVSFMLTGRGIARSGHKIFATGGGEELGVVTSGTFSPTLKKSIGMGYVTTRPESELDIEIRGERVSAKLTKTPFYKRSKDAAA